MLTIIARIIFWASLGIFLYILIGHGILLAVLRIFFSKPVQRKAITPDVCFIIPAYNEEKVIRAKLENTLALDYPKDRLKIVVVSDGCADRTDEIVKRMSKEDSRIILIRQHSRQGRAVAINAARKRYRAEVYAISDANVMLDKHALRELTANFADPQVGAVTARFIGLQGKGNPTEKGIDGYWSYEQWQRELESQIGSVSFISGSFNAVGGNLLTPVPADITHDHYVPAALTGKGFRSVYESRAVVYEYPADTPLEEVKIRTRNFLMGMNFLRELPRILNIWRHPWFFLNLLFRKILRWFCPLFLLISLIAAVFLIPEPAPLALLGLTGIGAIMTTLMVTFKSPPRWLSTAGFFGLSQIGLLWGIIQFVFGKRIVVWEPPR